MEIETENTKLSDKFLNKLNILKEQLPSILDDFKKYYVFYNKNPENNEYQQIFENIKTNLDSINSQLFMVKNNVQSETDKLNKNMVYLNELIQKDKKINIDVKNKLREMYGKNYSAFELISDYNKMYDIEYLRNWALLLSIILVCFVVSRVFLSKQQ
jgi:Ca2+-binding EF-hand superfamily protein